MRYIVQDSDGKELGRTVEFDSAYVVKKMGILYTHAGTMEGITIYPPGGGMVRLPLLAPLDHTAGEVTTISLDAGSGAE